LISHFQAKKSYSLIVTVGLTRTINVTEHNEMMIHAYQAAERKKRTLPSWFYFILILMNSGVFFLSDDKRIGFPFVREFYLACLCAFVVWIIFQHKHWFFAFSLANSSVLVYTILIFGLPAIFALMKFGQPIIYGLLEERRNLYLLIFFPLFYGLCVKDISPSELVKYVKISAGLCVATAFLYYFGVFHLNTHIFFSNSDLTAAHNWDLRYATRFVVGTKTVVLSVAIILFQLAKSKISLFDFLLLTASLFYIYFLDQARLVMLFIVCIGVFLWLTNIKFFMRAIFSMAFVILIASSLYIDTDILQAPIDKVIFLLNDASQPFDQRVRYKTGAIIFNKLMDNDFIGMGSLSNQWNSGFSSYYNDNFYLNDVGMVGLLYRYGILSFGIIFLYFYIFTSAMKGNHSFIMKALAWAYIMNTLVLFYFDTYILRGGQANGILLALLYYEKYFLLDQNSNNSGLERSEKGLDKTKPAETA